MVQTFTGGSCRDAGGDRCSKRSGRVIYDGYINDNYMITRWWFQMFFIFTPKIGEMIHFDDHISQMG